MRLKQLACFLGFTEEGRAELSDVLYETGRVTAKTPRERDDQGGRELAVGIALGDPVSIALGSSMHPCPRSSSRINVSRICLYRYLF